jgi:hypothetical protein
MFLSSEIESPLHSSELFIDDNDSKEVVDKNIINNNDNNNNNINNNNFNRILEDSLI